MELRTELIKFMEWYFTHPISMENDVQDDIDEYLKQLRKQ